MLLKPYAGEHCETVATGTLLSALGCDLSEPLLFGLGEGLGFVFLNLASLSLPFIGGRNKPFELTRKLCCNLGLACLEEETTSRRKAAARLQASLSQGTPVGLQVDCFHLPYFRQAPHFAGHFVAALQLQGDEVVVVDTLQQGGLQRLSCASLEQARFAGGPMSAKARAYTLHGAPTHPMAEALPRALRTNAQTYLTPAFSGMGATGIAKLARSLPLWLSHAASPAADLRLAALLMEQGGTGGGLFRRLYRDCLDEAVGHLPTHAWVLRTARDEFAQAAQCWSHIAQLLGQAATDGRAQPLIEAAGVCQVIAQVETSAMQRLARL